MSEEFSESCLKRDTFGAIYFVRRNGSLRTERRLDEAAPALRWLARRLLAREARALARIAGVAGTPRLLEHTPDRLAREWIAGAPMQVARPADPAYYREALRLVRRLHARGVAHNDLAKEPNWLVAADGTPALVDFQLATISTRRSGWFRVLAREDLRHLLKHKRSYCPAALTTRQRAMLARPAWPSRLWMATGKRVYLFVTRRLLNWSDREGAGDRGGL